MNKKDALAMADECERIALAATDPEKHNVYRHLQLAWLTLANHADDLNGMFILEFGRLTAIQAEIQGPNTLH